MEKKIYQTYQQWLEQQSTLEPLTKVAYLTILRYFWHWLEKQKVRALNSIDLELLYPFIHLDHHQKPFATGSVRVRAAALHLFFSWAYDQGYCRSNLMLAYKRNQVKDKAIVKRIYKISKSYSYEKYSLSGFEQKRLVATSCEHSWLDIRNRAIMAILLASGIFAEELLDLTIDQLNLKEGSLEVNSSRQRHIVLDKVLCQEACQAWLTLRAQVLEQQQVAWLFFNRRFGRLSKRTLHQVVTNYLSQANIKKIQHGPALLRQTAILARLESNESLEQIQKQMGIKTLARLQQYQAMLNTC